MLRMMSVIVALAMPVLVKAGDTGSQIAWDTKTLQQVKQGNPEKGKTLSETCKACHGQQGEGMAAEVVDGETIPAIPALAGQLANYTYKQLRDYFNDDRRHDAMTSVAKGLSEQDAADLAVWYASLPLPKQVAGKTNTSAENLVQNGDGKRIVPPCFVCHGAEGRGEKLDIPSLAGQQADYFASTLQAYKNNQRHNDIYSRMRLIAKQLSDEEIKLLAQYYQQLQ